MQQERGLVWQGKSFGQVCLVCLVFGAAFGARGTGGVHSAHGFAVRFRLAMLLFGVFLRQFELFTSQVVEHGVEALLRSEYVLPAQSSQALFECARGDCLCALHELYAAESERYVVVAEVHSRFAPRGNAHLYQ